MWIYALSDPVLIALIGVPAGVGAVISTWLGSRAKGKVDAVQTGVTAMREVIKILQDDNNDLRARATENDRRALENDRQRFEMQVQITNLTGQVNRCEADKAELKLEVGELRNRINDQGIA